MSWQSRVNPDVLLISPSGQTFRPLWVGNDREKEKALGVFKYPKARGAVIQDMGMGAIKEPMTFHFEGPDHDIEGQAFWNACDETGTWEILHPVKGRITRQLVSVREGIQPVTSGGVSVYECEWLEPGLDNPSVSIAQLEEEVRDQIDNVQDSAAQQFAAKVKTDKPSLLARLKAAVMKVVAIVNQIKATIAGIMATVAAVRQTILGILSFGVMLVNSLASAVMSLILLPGQIIKDLKSRFSFFNKVLDTTFKEFDKDFKSTYGASANTAAVAELVATACIVGMAQAVVDSSFSTREEALSYLEQMETATMNAINNLDGMQAAFSDSYIDRQYFSNTGTFADLMELLRRVRELILRRSFNLATAKHLTLRADRAPVEIAITEGVDLDTFIASNDLHGDEILLLPVGRQVVIYRG